MEKGKRMRKTPGNFIHIYVCVCVCVYFFSPQIKKFNKKILIFINFTYPLKYKGLYNSVRQLHFLIASSVSSTINFVP